ncbi:hypothetical protein MF271_15045 [Deinococcus sp. KNUC1210]|uniref:hypothetical protein n=1 Tax=Deinococcus sp. KNUC1210 TaxID=2917691 RepID=UPI001EEFE02E|nr:hypothetical protein [Deinococcus sp. KNUC1210]ULH15244.1 hypothetical protein MF271_15045 [Deinococcus sp. KNUC1210]
MSRAFTKEDGPTRWEPPVPPAAYTARLPGEAEALHESNDLLELLHWLQRQPGGPLEIRDRAGILLGVQQ